MHKCVLVPVLGLLLLCACSESEDGASPSPGCEPDPCTQIPDKECRVGRCVPGALQNDVSGDGRVSGSYDFYAGSNVSFTARPSGTGSAEATYALDTTQIAVSIGPGAAFLEIDGVQIDGKGPLLDAEQAMLDKLGGDPSAAALALVPLELGCQSRSVDAAVVAALVLPWQIGMKYGVQGLSTDPRTYTRQTGCRYFVDPTATEVPPARRHGAFLLSDEAPFPVVFGFSTLDVVGWSAHETLAGGSTFDYTESDVGPKGSRCRGACGIDCPEGVTQENGETNCKVTTDRECVEGSRLQNWKHYTCGTHPACVLHDACYDECARQHPGIWSTSDYVDCMHFETETDPATGKEVPVHCDQQAHDYAKSELGLDDEQARATCQSWALGRGPFAGKLAYSYKDGEPVEDASCSASAPDAGTSAEPCWVLCRRSDMSANVAHLGCYAFTGDCYVMTSDDADALCKSAGYEGWMNYDDTKEGCQQACAEAASYSGFACDT